MSKIKFTPTPVRLKEYKAPLQEAAAEIDRPLSWLILSILKEHPILKEYERKKSSTDNRRTQQGTRRM
jgi:hypothetical protein